MSVNALKEEVADEVEQILRSDFKINVTQTQTVPHSGDASITFPNLDNLSQGCKIIESCVLYIDIRRSTDLNFSHRAHTVSRLYSAFVRAMIRCAREYNGHVRGIIGDRVMVIFDTESCFKNAVNTAIAMNSVSKYVINKHFKSNEVTCGIGIDFGKMLATKTGLRRHGFEQSNYRNLVWLGRPANIASKLTDIANKPADVVNIKKAKVAYDYGSGWQWSEEHLLQFVSNIDVAYVPSRVYHKNPYFGSFFITDADWERRPATPAILMSEAIYNGFKLACPNDNSILNGWFEKVDVSVPNYTGPIYGGNVIFSAFKS